MMNASMRWFGGRSAGRKCAVAAAAVLAAALPALSAEWARTIGGTRGDAALSIAGTSDGGCAFCGFTVDEYGHSLWVVKLSPAGNLQWQKSIQSAFEDQGAAIFQTADRGYAVAGWINTRTWGDSPPDTCLLRLSAPGNVVWDYSVSEQNPSTHSREKLFSVCAGPGGSFIAAGTQHVSTPPDRPDSGYDACFLRISADGKYLWKRNWGGTGQDAVNSIRPAGDGGFIAAGETDSFGAGERDFWVLKIDAEGRPLWQRTYGGRSDDYARSVEPTRDGGYIVAGITETFGAGDMDAWVLKLDSKGSVEWQYTYGAAGGDYAHAVRQTADGGFIVAGSTASAGRGMDAWLLKLSSLGAIEWQKAYGGSKSESAFALDLRPGGGYYVAGKTRTFGNGNEDAMVLKVDRLGALGPGCTAFAKVAKTLRKKSVAVVMNSSATRGKGGVFESGPVHSPFVPARAVMKKPCG